ncbi:histidine kinase [Kaistia sp. 32K]|uniref:sensor histidine kinase n=1 Tax=Kaistia sp. 32K TaxID=2795690 RepID=UPI00191621F6|nr:sensor histidine kinase [Kaistia sp. 32K]BCP53811.1 histidine kinase [Kaistia sp. 32K]
MTLEELYRLLRSSHVQTQGIVDTLEEPLVVLDKALCVVNANPAFYRAFNTDRESTLDQSLFLIGNGQWDIPELRKLLMEVVPKAAAIVGYEVSHNSPALGQRTIRISARQLLHPDNNSTQLLVVFDDVTEQQRAAETKNILVAETRHRMKNLIAIVKAIVRQTAAKGLSGEEYRTSLMGRINAVFDAQDFISSSEESADLSSLISQSLKPIAGSRARIIPGPAVSLTRYQVLPATMILHELATNAFKYGALSNESGIIQVSWSTELQDGQRHLLLDWREEGGPLVYPPNHRGFGSQLIEFSAKAEGGASLLDFDPAGVRVQIRLPLAQEVVDGAALAST